MEQKEQSEDEINDSPIEQVRLTVPITDDPTLPALTFRTWILGPLLCIFLSFLTQLTNFRQNVVLLPTTGFTLLLLPIGKLMAEILPTKSIRVPLTNWTFTMNPGPFNIKEHVLVTILATSGLNSPFSLTIIAIMKVFYHKNVSFLAAFLLIQTSQMVGYGFAGIFMRFLVNSPYMWWPFTLVDVSLYRMLHEVEVKPKKQLTRLHFFTMVSVSSFAYYIIPNYLFPSITALSFVCWIWKDSVTAHQIGSGLHGLGMGSFSVDWSSITTFLGSPLIVPMFAIVNMIVGFILFIYIVVPIAYWSNAYGAKRFPIFSNGLFDVNGQGYNVSRVLNEDMTFNRQSYHNYSAIYLSIVFIYSIGFKLGTETATVTHFVLFHARETWQQFQLALKGVDGFNDVHNRLMNKYKRIPQWWFYAIILPTIGLALFNSMALGKEFQLPYWGILLGYLFPFILILPIGVINATTGQANLDMYLLSQLLFGSIYPGNPLANLAFKSYSTSTLNNALDFIPQFKLAHYMKIPPRSMFIAQIVGAFISNSASLGAMWWFLSAIENICDTKKLPKGSPWTCPGARIMFSQSIIWGGVGPSHMFAPYGLYSNIYFMFLIGVIATVLVWIVSRMFPEKKWIRLINIPLILSSVSIMPPAAAVNYLSWFVVAIIFQYVVYRKYKGWWAKYNYLLSNGLDTGTAFMTILTTLTLNLKDIYGVQWWGLDMDDHCPLATCPSAPGIKVDGCPVFQ